MQTKDVEIEVGLPKAMLESTFSGEKPMRLATISASPRGYETHQRIQMAMINCLWIKRSNQVCYDCRRQIAA
jgi:hypothetical protein